jgi:hypothetical protein
MQAPTWKELGEAYAEDDQVAIAHVDCTVSRNVCSKLEVRLLHGGGCWRSTQLPVSNTSADTITPLHSDAEILLGAKCLCFAQIAGYPTVKLIHKGQPTAYSGEWTRTPCVARQSCPDRGDSGSDVIHNLLICRCPGLQIIQEVCR